MLHLNEHSRDCLNGSLNGTRIKGFGTVVDENRVGDRASPIILHFKAEAPATSSIITRKNHNSGERPGKAVNSTAPHLGL
jgi:hypothetical protein